MLFLRFGLLSSFVAKMQSGISVIACFLFSGTTRFQRNWCFVTFLACKLILGFIIYYLHINFIVDTVIANYGQTSFDFRVAISKNLRTRPLPMHLVARQIDGWI